MTRLPSEQIEESRCQEGPAEIRGGQLFQFVLRRSPNYGESESAELIAMQFNVQYVECFALQGLDGRSEMFALAVRFDIERGRSGDFDDIVLPHLEIIRHEEPGTLVYFCNAVEGAEDSRFFFELYEDKVAFEVHDKSVHVREMFRILDPMIVQRRVELLSPSTFLLNPEFKEE